MPSLLAFLGLDATRFQNALAFAEKNARDSGNKIGSFLSHGVNSAMEGFALVGESAVVEGIRELGMKTLEYAEQVADLSRRLGISTDAVQEWDFVLKQNGSTIDSAAGFFEKMAMARSKALSGNGEMIASFQKLGISIEKLKNERLEELGLSIAKTFETGDPQKLIASLREVGGKGAGEMVAAFRGGFEELIEEARNAGTVIDKETIGRLKDAGDEMKTVWAEARAAAAPFFGMMAKYAHVMITGARALGAASVGYYKDGIVGAREALSKLEKDMEKHEAAAKKRANVKPFLGGDDEGPDTKAAHAALREAEKIMRLKEQLFRITQENDLKSLNKEQQIQELIKRRKALVESMQEMDERGAMSDSDRLEAQIEVAKIDKELRETKLDKDPHTSHKLDVNALQRIGAYAPIQADREMTDIQKKNEKHLSAMAKSLAYLEKNAQGCGGGTQY